MKQKDCSKCGSDILWAVKCPGGFSIKCDRCGNMGRPAKTPRDAWELWNDDNEELGW